ncbi:hypothetical protein Tco_0453398 [Tanacetum coccineum]
MAALKFASSNNMVAFLDKPTESDGFEQIVDFLNAHPIKYALTVNPTIYTACIEQFWATAKVKTVNGEVHIQALMDKNKVIITKTSIRKDLQLEDAEVFLDKQVEGMSKHKEIYVTPSHTKKVFANMKRRKQRKATEVSQPSGLTEPMANETENVESVPKHSNDPLLSEKTKTSQAVEITELKERVKKLEKKKGSRTHRLRRLYKVGRSARVVSSKDEGLGDQEDASKQGRKIADIDADAEDVVKKEVSTTEFAIDSATTTTVDELTLAQTLIEIKAAKPKVVTNAVTRPKDRGVVVQEPKEEKLARQREEYTKIVEWDNVQAMMDADYELAARLQAEEQGELTIEEKSRLFMEVG